MFQLMSDLRWSLRLIRRRPTLAAAVVLTLGVAICAVTTAFGVSTAVLWRPLPFAQPDRLIFVWENTARDRGVEPARVTGYRFVQWQRGTKTLASMALFGAAGFLADRGDGAAMVNGVRVSTNYFDTLGIAPMLGRRFVWSDGDPGAERVVILSHALWQEWFGGRTDVVGRDIRLGGQPYTIVGVIPPVVFQDGR